MTWKIESTDTGYTIYSPGKLEGEIGIGSTFIVYAGMVNWQGEPLSWNFDWHEETPGTAPQITYDSNGKVGIEFTRVAVGGATGIGYLTGTIYDMPFVDTLTVTILELTE